MRLIEVEAGRRAVESDLLANLLLKVRSSRLFDPLTFTVRSIPQTCHLVFNSKLILVLQDGLSVQSLRHELFAGHTLACEQAHVGVLFVVRQVEAVRS